MTKKTKEQLEQDEKRKTQKQRNDLGYSGSIDNAGGNTPAGGKPEDVRDNGTDENTAV